MRDYFLSILIIVLVIVFLMPEFLKLSEYDKINKCKGPIKSEYYP
jgi:hypothetical protein